MTVKDYLLQYSEKQKQLHRIKYRITKLEEEISVSAININGMPHGSGISKPTERDAMLIMELIEKYKNQREEAYRLMDEISAVIDSVDNDLQRTVLHARYIELRDNGTTRSWNAIAKQLSYESCYMRQIHRKGLNTLNNIIHNIKQTNTN